MATGRQNNPFLPLKPGWKVPVAIFLMSVIYFADVFVRASRKCFWFDELFTIYLCRLPNFQSTWTAVKHGADFNPPLLYLLTRGVQWLFGEGLISTRLPAMVGVWLFCICLFVFVARRVGVISGFIAGVFPFFTLAQYYAYEARAHGVLLGWCGLALVCWQKRNEERASYLWLIGFGLSLLGALLTHVYAVYLLFPFAIVEIYNLFDKPNWGNCIAMGSVFTGVTLAVYLPLFRVYRAAVPAFFFAASHDLIPRFLTNVIGPALIVLLLSIVLTALAATRPHRQFTAAIAIPGCEIVLAAGFVCIPLVGLLGSKLSHGPFIDRYFLSSIAGYAIFFGFATSLKGEGNGAAKALAGCMFLLMLVDLGSVTYLAMKQRVVLMEPSAEIRLSTTPREPMALFEAIAENDRGLDILIPSPLEYIYFFRYGSPSVVAHLYFAGAPDNLFFTGYQRLAKEARLNLKETSYEIFLANHDRFLMYESSGLKVEGPAAIGRAGYCLKSARSDVMGTLYEFAK